jgi:hypothetical protein
MEQEMELETARVLEKAAQKALAKALELKKVQVDLTTMS